MERSKFKWLVICLIFMFIIGCSSTDPSSNHSQGGNNKGGNETAGERSDTSVEPVELMFWVAGNSEQQQLTYNAIIAQFNSQYADQGIRAEVQYVPWAELQQKLTTSLAGRVGPDLFSHGAAAAAGFAAMNQLEPLDRYLETWPDTDDYIDSYLNAGVVDGHHYVLPTEGDSRLLIYRKDIFDEVGVTVPTTWEELKNVARKVTIQGGERYATDLPTNGINLQQFWTPYLWSNGGDLFNSEYTAATLNTPEAIGALEYYKSFYDEGLVSLTGILGQGDQHPLGTGEIAFTVDGAFVLNQIRTYTPDVYEHIGIAAPPRGSGDPTIYVGSAGIYMNAGSKHKDEAWLLLSFIGSKENSGKIAAELNYLPVRESLIEEEYVRSDPLFQQFVELTSQVDGKANPNIQKWTAARDILARNIELALYGQVSVEEALSTAEAEINAELNK